MTTMIRPLRHLTIAAMALLLAGCSGPCDRIEPLTGPTITTGSADLTTIASIGTSITAGYQSGGLVVHHQQRAFPNLLAMHVGALPFTGPIVSADGFPPLLRIRSLQPLVINNLNRTQGVLTNGGQTTSFHNLGVPGALLADVTSAIAYTRSPYFNLVTRNRGTILAQAASLTPTFLTFEFGSTEILAPAFAGQGTPLMTPEDFATMLTATMNEVAVAIPDAKIAMFNLPDPFDLPYFGTFPTAALDTNGAASPLIGPDGPLGPGDRVLLTASDSLSIGTGFATNTRSYASGVFGNGRPLPDSLVLSEAEALEIRNAMFAYCAVIDSVADGRGAARVDLLGLLDGVATNGYAYRGMVYTEDFLTGGLFSLDGVHPTDFGQGLITNAVIDAINQKFGATIRHLDLSTVGTFTSSLRREVTPGMPRLQGASASSLFPWRAVRRPS